MILPFHIIVAIASLIFTGYLYFSPTKHKLRISYALVATTFGSGAWLIVSNPSHLMQSCLYGIIYLGVVFFGIALARNKLSSTAK